MNRKEAERSILEAGVTALSLCDGLTVQDFYEFILKWSEAPRTAKARDALNALNDAVLAFNSVPPEEETSNDTVEPMRGEGCHDQIAEVRAVGDRDGIAESPDEALLRSRKEVADRILKGDADEVVGLLGSGEMTWNAVFGMEDFILFPAYIAGFDPDSVLCIQKKEVLRDPVQFLDEIVTRASCGHRLLRHDDPVSRSCGFADMATQAIFYVSLPRMKERPRKNQNENLNAEHPGYAIYQGLTPSTYTVRIPRNYESVPVEWDGKHGLK